MTPLTDEQLAEIRAHAEQIPPIGPLVVAFPEEIAYATHCLWREVPMLLAEIERLKKGNELLLAVIAKNPDMRHGEVV